MATQVPSDPNETKEYAATAITTTATTTATTTTTYYPHHIIIIIIIIIYRPLGEGGIILRWIFRK